MLVHIHSTQFNVVVWIWIELDLIFSLFPPFCRRRRHLSIPKCAPIFPLLMTRDCRPLIYSRRETILSCRSLMYPQKTMIKFHQTLDDITYSHNTNPKHDLTRGKNTFLLKYCSQKLKISCCYIINKSIVDFLTTVLLSLIHI